jgi:methionyl-tRNA synthetase
MQRGYLYKGTHKGWYSVTDECFYKDSQIEDRQDSTGLPIKVAMETGSQVEWTSEENYCFRLSRVQNKLIDYYKEFNRSIVPKTYYLDVVKALEEPLEDLSISRPRARLSWGIEVPDDPEQTIYVWFDALINYLTVTGYPWSVAQNGNEGDQTSNPPAESKDLFVGDRQWPADVHVIGKDIVRWDEFLNSLIADFTAFSGPRF